MGETEEREFDVAVVVDGWQTFDFASGPPLMAATNYLIAVWAESGANWAVRCRVNSGGGNGIEADTSETYGPTFPNPLVNSALAGYKMAIYCTYTESATGPKLLALTGAGK